MYDIVFGDYDYVDVPAGGGELDGVDGQVEQDLMHAIRVRKRHSFRRLVLQVQHKALLLGHRSRTLHHIPGDPSDGYLHGGDLEASGFDPGEDIRGGVPRPSRSPSFRDSEAAYK